MARPLRIEYPVAYYHVASRGQRKESIFRDDQDRENSLNLRAHGVIPVNLKNSPLYPLPAVPPGHWNSWSLPLISRCGKSRCHAFRLQTIVDHLGTARKNDPIRSTILLDTYPPVQIGSGHVTVGSLDPAHLDPLYISPDWVFPAGLFYSAEVNC
jgi:hypothetical protein